MTTNIFNLLFDCFYDGNLRSWDFDGYRSIRGDIAPTYPVSNVKYDKEKEDLIFELAVTGFKEEELEITIRDNFLTISALSKKELEKESISYIHKSLAKRNFTHTWRIDEHQNLNALKAKLENGLLTIIIPAKEKEKEKIQKIKIGE